jgi:hypothetical protein
VLGQLLLVLHVCRNSLQEKAVDSHEAGQPKSIDSTLTRSSFRPRDPRTGPECFASATRENKISLLISSQVTAR